MVPDTPPEWDPLMDPDPLLLPPSGQEALEQDIVPPVQVTPLGGSMRLYHILGDPPSAPPPPKPRLLLVLLPWLGAQPGHLWPYLRWYLGHGLDVLVVPTKAWHFLRPQRGQRLARSLLRALEDGEGETGGGGISHAGGSNGDGGMGLAGGHSGDSEGGTHGSGDAGSGGAGPAGGSNGGTGGGIQGVGDDGSGGTGPASGSNGGTGGTDHTGGDTHGVGDNGSGGTGPAGTNGGTDHTGGGTQDVGDDGSGGTGPAGANGGGGGDIGLAGADGGGGAAAGASTGGAAGGAGINAVCLGTGASGASRGAAGASALARRPLLVHAISVGAYTFAQVLLLLRQHPAQCQRLAPRFRGIVYDSLVTGDFGDMAKGLANAVPSSPLRPIVRASAHFYLWALGCCVGRELALARAAFANPPLRCPLLLFYSLDDELSQAPTLQALLAGWRAMGIRAHAVGWQQSRHAAHLRWHPREYRRALLAFLKLTEGAPQAKL